MIVSYEEMQRFSEEVNENDMTAVRARLAKSSEWANASYSEHGERGLHYAKTAEMAELLIQHGADVNSPDSESQTPLLRCAKEGWLGPIPILITSGANPELEDDRGYTPLMWAAQDPINGKTTTKHLIDGGAEVDILSAVGLGDTARVKEVLAKNPGAPEDIQADDLLVPLLAYGIGSQKDKTEALRMILDHDPTITVDDLDTWISALDLSGMTDAKKLVLKRFA